MRRGRHIHTYKTNAEFEEAYYGSYYHEPWVSYTKSDDRVDYNLSEEERKLRTPLTFDFISSGSVVWYFNNPSYQQLPGTIYYKLNSGEWTEMPVNTPIAVSSGDTMQFKGDNPKYAIVNAGTTADTYYAFFPQGVAAAGSIGAGTPARFNARGNIMSLINSEGFEALDSFSAGTVGNFERLFAFTGIVDASGLIFPVKNLTVNCCRNMFCDCQWITVPMDISRVETLASLCFNGMFMRANTNIWSSGVPASGLTPGADYLPWTTLATNCYQNMFSGCILLSRAPELPATTLVNMCYRQMFNNCTMLNYIKAMFTTTPSTDYTANWVNGVSATGTFVKNSAAQWDVTGTNGIPQGWTVQTASE